MKNKILFLILGIILFTSMIGFVNAVPYSTNFDVRNMVGFNDGTITANDVLAYIQSRNPSSPMIYESNIGQSFINYGISNNVNPAFLIATAKLEGQFGTSGWAIAYPQCHNTFGYGVPSGSTLPNYNTNCANSYADMIYRVDYNIAYGPHYYKSGKYTVDQIRTVYAGQPNSQSIANLMNDLYTFAQSRHTTCSNQCSSGQLRCNGFYSESCIFSNNCWIWGGDSYCQNGCAYGQCINSCVPKTCSQLGKQCGGWDNGCSQSISCGSCSSGQTCNSNGQCVSTCVPKTCSQLGKQCGAIDNGCGQSISCGSCSSGQTCNSNGQCVSTCSNQCAGGSMRCNNGNSEMCNDYNHDGCNEWGINSYCQSGCSASLGICYICVPSSKYCNGNNAMICGSDGLSSSGTACSSSQTCSNGFCVNNNPICTPNWQCSSWSSCLNNQQTRTCTDSNNCGTNNGKPVVVQSCTSSSVNSHNSDCTFVTNNNMVGTSWTINDYINYNGQKWIAVDVNGDGNKEIFGFSGDDVLSCPSDGTYRHTLSTVSLGGFKLQYFNNPYCSNCDKSLTVCTNNANAVYTLNYNLPSNPTLSCA